MGCRGTTSITMVLTIGCSGFCFDTWSTFSPSFSHFGVCMAVSLTFFWPLSHSFCATRFPFLNTHSQRHHYGGWGAQLYPVVGPLEWLELPVLIMRQSQSLLPEATPAGSVTSTWAPAPNTVLKVTDTVQGPTISALLLRCLSTSNPTQFKVLVTSLCSLRKWRKEYQQFIHTNSIFSESIWKLACRNSRLGRQFGICKLSPALTELGSVWVIYRSFTTECTRPL